MSRTVSIVVPVYFNAESLAPLMLRFVNVEQELMRRHDVRLQLVFVDDGSKDASREVLASIKRAQPAVTVVALTRNFGAVHAVRAGLRFVEGEAFAVFAADLQDPPELLFELVPLWLARHRFCIAVRTTRNDPWLSRTYSWLYYRLLRRLVVPGYPATGFDVALMDASLLPPMRDSSKSTFGPLLAYWLGVTPAVVQYARPARQSGRSRWTFRKKWNAFLDVMLGFSVTPIRLISAVGALVSVVSFLYGAVVVIGAVLGANQVSGFPTLAALITFLLGLIILMLGVIGEYLWRIFDEINRRPETVIDYVD